MHSMQMQGLKNRLRQRSGKKPNEEDPNANQVVMEFYIEDE